MGNHSLINTAVSVIPSAKLTLNGETPHDNKNKIVGRIQFIAHAG